LIDSVRKNEKAWKQACLQRERETFCYHSRTESCVPDCRLLYHTERGSAIRIFSRERHGAIQPLSGRASHESSAGAFGRGRGGRGPRSTPGLTATRRGWHLPMTRYRPVHKMVLRNNKVRAVNGAVMEVLLQVTVSIPNARCEVKRCGAQVRPMGLCGNLRQWSLPSPRGKSRMASAGTEGNET